MKIFAAHDGGSGCCYYRVELPLREMQKHGYDVTFVSARDDGPGVTGSMMAGHDLIVGQRFNAPAGVRVYREARTPSTRLVYEIDDDVFHITAENWQAYHLWKRPEIVDAAVHAMEVADLITCSTEPLAEVLREYNSEVAVLPNHIPGWVCDLERRRRERPAVGWAGGASHGVDVGLVTEPVKRFLKRFPGWDLRLAGTDYRPSFKVGDRAVFSKWVQVNDDELGFYSSPDWDIGLAPVAAAEFTKSKSAVKALEWAALGIPVIASDWHPYRDFIRHGETGFLVKHDHEWLRYMSELAGDDTLRESMGVKAREQARQWAIEDGWTLWRDAYERLFT